MKLDTVENRVNTRVAITFVCGMQEVFTLGINKKKERNDERKADLQTLVIKDFENRKEIYVICMR